MYLSLETLLAGALWATAVHGFTVQPRATTLTRQSPSATSLYGIRCEDKYYQLEEMEDRENSTTELFLTSDGSIEFGETDGPLWSAAEGYWQVAPGTDDFTMTIVRRFDSGRSKTDMGEFSYAIGRCYKGVMTKVGDSVGITGVMHPMDAETGQAELDQNVGYFNMIDGTDIRQDRREDARPYFTRSS